MTIQIALLRGINVGGKNKIKMAELKIALGELGLSRVQTYIQSGNILFDSDEEEAVLCERISAKINEAFGLNIPVMLRSAQELNEIVASCPFTAAQIEEAESASDSESLYVAMLLHAPEPEKLERLQQFATNEEQFRMVGRNIYLLYHNSIRDSKLAVQVEKLGVLVTTRNWKTVNKLIAMADEMASENYDVSIAAKEDCDDCS
ncbi:DUF1697 domain-containing protein [Paenibacillus sp. NPDC058071]|uniref:DUF1697 domain-containing protein n=1 Tax=Paenibacillus sp. NPDC058071 TaxID=3346326 RepID=UPI0036DE64C0